MRRELELMRENRVNPLHSGRANEVLQALVGTPVGDAIANTLRNFERFRKLTESVGSYGSPGIRGIGAYRLYAAEQVMSGVSKSDPDLVDAVTQFGSFLHFLRHFEALRKLWVPQNGTGSQHTGWKSHALLAAMVYQVAKSEIESEEYVDAPPETTDGPSIGHSE